MEFKKINMDSASSEDPYPTKSHLINAYNTRT